MNVPEESFRKIDRMHRGLVRLGMQKMYAN